MAYEMVMPYHLHMPSYFLETFTEYPYLCNVFVRTTGDYSVGKYYNHIKFSGRRGYLAVLSPSFL